MSQMKIRISNPVQFIIRYYCRIWIVRKLIIKQNLIEMKNISIHSNYLQYVIFKETKAFGINTNTVLKIMDQYCTINHFYLFLFP